MLLLVSISAEKKIYLQNNKHGFFYFQHQPLLVIPVNSTILLTMHVLTAILELTRMSSVKTAVKIVIRELLLPITDKMSAPPAKQVILKEYVKVLIC